MFARRRFSKPIAGLAATAFIFRISAPASCFDEMAEIILSAGVHGVLVSPLLVGIDTVRHLSEKYPFAVMAHPTFSGTFFHDRNHGMLPAVLLGTIFRLAGADISVFPNAGGRFGFTPQECAGIGEHLRRPMGPLRSSLPAPAGGMKYENIPAIARQYGEDTIFLSGAALLSHGKNLSDSTRYFLDGVRAHFSEKLVPPKLPNFSCEIPLEHNLPAAILECLRFDQFKWAGRTVLPYKPADDLTFKKVARQELIGGTGEKTAFDLRYFEIGPGGYTSLEKHVHTHCIIVVRGKGTLRLEKVSHSLGPLDVAYVPPLAVHQLRSMLDVSRLASSVSWTTNATGPG